MQVVDAAFTAEENDSLRKIASSLLVSWHRYSLLANRTFTIGVSLIGGDDLIGANPGSIGSPGNYKYFNESDYVMSLGWERGYSMPLGGLTKALAEAQLDNSTGRFTPRYMGGNSELFTAILPGRPAIINAGFNIGGVDISIPQFAGIINEQPQVNVKQAVVNLKMADYVDYFQNKFLDNAVMFTSQRTDQVLTTLSTQLGMSTAQYDYDTGINIIPFGYFPAGARFSDVFSQLVEAENGHFYQDESGIFKFENRDHWAVSPYNSVQKIILTGQVIDAEAPNTDHLINIVEVNTDIRTKQSDQLIFQLSTPTVLKASADTEIFINFDDPILFIDTPVATTNYLANQLADGTGTNRTTSVSLKSISKFAQAAKLVFTNSIATDLFLTDLKIYGRPAKVSTNLYARVKDDSSVTAFNEHAITIDNPFINTQEWANSLGQMLVNDFSSPENIQKITIRAIPELQLGDLISWQGRYWRLFDIKTTLDPSVGFIQELTMLQRTITDYFRIGISTIGGSDKIAP